MTDLSLSHTATSLQAGWWPLTEGCDFGFAQWCFQFTHNYSLKPKGRERTQIVLDLLKLLLPIELCSTKRYRMGIPLHWSPLKHCPASSCPGLWQPSTIMSFLREAALLPGLMFFVRTPSLHHSSSNLQSQTLKTRTFLQAFPTKKELIGRSEPSWPWIFWWTFKIQDRLAPHYWTSNLSCEKAWIELFNI